MCALVSPWTRLRMFLGETVPAEFQSGGAIEVSALRGFEAVGQQRVEVARYYLAPALAEATRCKALKPYYAPPRFGCLISALALVGAEVPTDRRMAFLHSACQELHARVSNELWCRLPLGSQSALLAEAVCRQLLAGPLSNVRRVATYQDSFCHELVVNLSEVGAQRCMSKLMKSYGGFPTDPATLKAFNKELETMPSETPSLEELGLEYEGMGSKVCEQGLKFDS